MCRGDPLPSPATRSKYRQWRTATPTLVRVFRHRLRAPHFLLPRCFPPCRAAPLFVPAPTPGNYGPQAVRPVPVVPEVVVEPKEFRARADRATLGTAVRPAENMFAGQVP